ncbi:hypothetical protein H5S09_03650 [Limosilactobacillus sp. STM2_1]|uniref:Uncharacterized protein n=1 Tax=Limosilactobacillus rudii TaxID=2759755 RepID=A0A7W3UK53_9LACO|nr:hypothetical protein [Limosilactobacillus rudii]MBB1079078.1 hypothetical protein [Limosilactobacillus rudii]MBB1097047.1 hypothetical protein [Limosilactobacillus rudii]MCD7134015.1 hypothetical protein [Limosilactobacillus rudii]
MWDVIGTGLIAGVIAALVNVLVAKWSNQTQRETTKMLNLEKTNEVTLEWNNETRELISKFVKTCFQTYQVYNTADSLVGRFDEAIKSNSNDQIFDNITDDAKTVIKNSNQTSSELYALQAQIRMHLYDDHDYLVIDINNQIEKVIEKLESNRSLPVKEINDLIDLSREYFSIQWERIKNENVQ